MDPRRREKLLAQIPTSDLRIEAFKKLGNDRSVDLMLDYQRQLEEIKTGSDTQVPVRHIYTRAILIGAIAGTGLASLLVLGGKMEADVSSLESFKNVIATLTAGGFVGGCMGFLFGASAADIARNETRSVSIWSREDSIQEQHRVLLEEQLDDDQVAALFLHIAAEE